MSVAVPSTTGSAQRWFRPALRQLWHHYRALRGLCLALLAFLIGLQWVWGIFELAQNGNILGAMAAIGFAIAAPAVILTSEAESRTHTRLMLMPGEWRRSFLVVLISIAVPVICFLCVGSLNEAAVRCVVSNGQTNFQEALQQSTPSMVVVVLTIVATLLGLVAAFNSRNVMMAIAIATGGLVLFMLCTFLSGVTGDERILYASPFAIVPLLLLAVWSANRWFSEGQIGFNLLFPEMRASTGNCPKALSKILQNDSTSQQLREARLLSWREASKWPWFVATLVPLWIMARAMPSFAVFLPVVVGLFCGLGCFRSEQHKHRFRFLRDRGVSASAVWCSNQHVWLTRAVIGGAVIAIGFAMRIDELHYGPATTIDWFLTAFVGYGIAQACSLLIARPAIAVAAAVFVFLAAASWLAYLIQLRVPIVWSAISFGAGGLFISWWNCHEWMEERLNKTVWARTVILLCGVLGACYLTTALFRATEIPRFFVSPDGKKHAGPSFPPHVPTDEGVRNAEQLVEICERLLVPSSVPGESLTLPPIQMHLMEKTPVPWDGLSKETKEWVRSHSDVADELTRLLGKNEFYFEDRRRADGSLVEVVPAGRAQFGTTERPHLDVLAGRYLGILLLELEGARLHAEGDFAASQMAYYTAANGLWKCVSSDSPGRDLITAYAGVGRIVRRAAELEFERLLTAKEIDPDRDYDPAFYVRIQPESARVSSWVHDVEMRETTGPHYFESEAFGGNRLGWSRGWLLYPVDRSESDLPFDFLTFGHRSKCLSRWLHQRRCWVFQVGRSQESLSTWMTGVLEHHYEGNYARFAYDPLCSRPIHSYYNAEPLHWLRAARDLETDVAAAVQLVKLARHLRESESREEAMSSFDDLVIDPWSGSDFEWVSKDAQDFAPDIRITPNPPGFRSNGFRSDIVFRKEVQRPPPERRFYPVPDVWKGKGN